MTGFRDGDGRGGSRGGGPRPGEWRVEDKAGPEESAVRPDVVPARPAVAVALKGDSGAGGPPPRIVASGRGALAEAIVEIAFREGVKVREDGDLAEMLAAVDIDSEIPAEALIAVAEILRYLYASRDGTQPATAERDPSFAPGGGADGQSGHRERG